MERPLDLLTSDELLALAVEATKRGDSAHSMAYLKAASERADTSAEVLFLLGSEYAQVGMIEQARHNLQRSVDLAPHHALARFQLGLLQLTSGLPDLAEAAWAPLEALDPTEPQAASLQAFRRGLCHLIRDEFAATIDELERGMSLNVENPALNANMQRMVDAVRVALSRSDATRPATGADAETEDAQPGHLFVNAYTRGLPH